MQKLPAGRFLTILFVLVAIFLLRDDLVRFAGEAPSPDHPVAATQKTRANTASLPASSAPAASREEKRSAIRGPIWTSTRTRTARENAVAHWEKHRREFPEYHSAEEYIEGAHLFLRGPPEGTEEKRRPNGDRLLYHAASNTFAVQARSGAPRTMFRPDDRKRYWNRQ